MFFDRENEPDLGDEFFGRRNSHDDNFYTVEDIHTPTNPPSIAWYTIPLSFYNMTESQLIEYFTNQRDIHNANLVELKRQEKIAALKRELKRLEEGL